MALVRIGQTAVPALPVLSYSQFVWEVSTVNFSFDSVSNKCFIQNVPQLFIQDKRYHDPESGKSSWIYFYHSGWLDRRLRGLFGLGYPELPSGTLETSTYGPLCCLLNSIFPSHLSYIIKPQAILHGMAPTEVTGSRWCR